MECSPDLRADPSDRDFPEQTLEMIVETNDEGILRDLISVEGDGAKSGNESKSKWLKVGTPIGVIDDGEDVDGDWTWQAYIHTRM